MCQPTSISHFNNMYIWQWVTETLTVRCVLCVIHYTLTLERGVVQWCKEKRRSVVKTLDKEDWGSNPFWSAQIFGRHSNLSVGRNILASKDILVSRNILVGRDIVNFSADCSWLEKCWCRQAPPQVLEELKHIMTGDSLASTAWIETLHLLFCFILHKLSWQDSCHLIRWSLKKCIQAV